MKIVKLLLKAGVNPNQANIYGNIPSLWASYYGHLETVELLLKAGADPNRSNVYGETSIYYAAYNGHLEIIELLKLYKNKISSLSLLCLQIIYRNQINTDGIPRMILEWNFHQ